MALAASSSMDTNTTNTRPILLSWGANSYGQLGTGDTKDRSLPGKVLFALESVAQLAGGGGHTALLTCSGEVCLCGNNNRGQVGLATSGGLVMSLHCLNFPSIVLKVACGWEHTLAITVTGEVFGWGSDSHGQLSHASSSSPSKVQGLDGHTIIDVAAGLRHSLAVADDGSVWSWGSGKKGQLGRPDELETGSTSFGQPGIVSGISRGKKVVAGAYHSLAVTDEGQLFGWGDNKWGQLAVEPNKDASINSKPIRQIDLYFLKDREVVIAIASGWTHTLLLTDNGHVYSWGRNDYGQLGRMSVSMTSTVNSESSMNICWTPTEIKQLSRVTDIACGSEHNVASTDGPVDRGRQRSLLLGLERARHVWRLHGGQRP